ncbi:hypothetical protein [uncultured Aquimarina sp.]|uniref:hypothetical protein n=1 Tax=uncultured Aquimarina sp. TaxID=575652 RepID=UPI0026217DF4|nr:hypothetical protein [uncultured Aquimarina sp.]
MSKIDKYFYKWDSSKLESIVQLGDSKKELLSSGLIKDNSIDKKENEYSGINGDPWRIDFFEDAVCKVWYNRESSFKINNTELIGEEFVSIQEIIENNYENLNDKITGIQEINLFNDSDILYIICRDFFVILIAVIRPTIKVQ